jgi:hypothetical protein
MCTICQNFINYWDNEIRTWHSLGGKITPNESFWNNVVPKSNLLDILMPEPYWGNPENCSVVMLNYNPGGSKLVSPNDPCHFNQCNNPLTMAGAMWQQYSDIALTFPWLDSYYTGICANTQHLGTAIWMRRHAAWAYRVCNITTPLETQPRPFFFDLCGWHTHNWKGDISKLPANVISQLGNIISAAISHSSKNLGLCVGFDFTSILPQLGYQDVTLQCTRKNTWQPIPGNNRNYKAYRHPNGTRIICTWAQGSNQCPSANFKADEQRLESML